MYPRLCIIIFRIAISTSAVTSRNGVSSNADTILSLRFIFHLLLKQRSQQAALFQSVIFTSFPVIVTGISLLSYYFFSPYLFDHWNKIRRHLRKSVSQKLGLRENTLSKVNCIERSLLLIRQFALVDYREISEL